MFPANCSLHADAPIIAIKYQDNKATFLCEECLLALQDDQNRLNVGNIIFIRAALNKPQQLLSKLNIQFQKYPQFFNLLTKQHDGDIEKQVKQFEKELKQIKRTIDLVIVELNNFAASTLQTKMHLQTEIMKLISYDQFQTTLSELDHFDPNSQKLEEIEQKIEKYISDLQQSVNLNQQINELLSQEKYMLEQTTTLSHPQLTLLEHQIAQFNQQAHLFTQHLSLNQKQEIIQIPKSPFVSQEYLAELNHEIEQRSKQQIEEINLIYRSQEDGLNSYSFWNKVNGKRNLLVILKSKSNSIFGGYSPCQWLADRGDFMEDESLTSFLFSQTNREIYPLKKENQKTAIYCARSYGPTFGGGYDIYVNMDFTAGYSSLGHSYRWNGYQGGNSAYLFGGNKPNIIECQVYEIKLR